MSLQSSTARRCCTGHMMAVKTKMSCQDINKKFSDEDTVLGTETILFRDINSAMLMAKYIFNQNICETFVEASFLYIFFVMRCTVSVCFLNILLFGCNASPQRDFL